MHNQSMESEEMSKGRSSNRSVHKQAWGILHYIYWYMTCRYLLTEVRYKTGNTHLISIFPLVNRSKRPTSEQGLWNVDAQQQLLWNFFLLCTFLVPWHHKMDDTIPYQAVAQHVEERFPYHRIITYLNYMRQGVQAHILFRTEQQQWLLWDEIFDWHMWSKDWCILSICIAWRYFIPIVINRFMVSNLKAHAKWRA